MGREMRLRIKDWAHIFENAGSRKLKRLDWVAVPNKTDGEGYTALVDHPHGAAHLGAWLAIIEVASKQSPRGFLPGGEHHDLKAICRALARMSRLPSITFEQVIPRLLDPMIGWLERFVSSEPEPLEPPELGWPPDALGESADASGDVGGELAAQDTTGQGTTGQGKDQNLSPTEVGEDDNLPLVPALEKSKRPKSCWYDSAHEAWYQSFWNHKAKAASRIAFEKRVNLLVDKDKRMNGVYKMAYVFLARMVQDDQSRFEGTEDWESRVRMHPATWLNKERWTDEEGKGAPKKLNRHQETHQQTLGMLKFYDAAVEGKI